MEAQMEIYMLVAAQKHNSYDWVDEENRKIAQKIDRTRAIAGWVTAKARRLGAALADRQGRADGAVSAQ